MGDNSVMLIQQGARRNYIYARKLADAGLLHSVVTDLAFADGKPGLLRRALTELAPGLARTLDRRVVRGVPPSRVKASMLPLIASELRRVMHEEYAFALADDVQGIRQCLRGLGGAKVVVNYQGNGGLFLDYAKRRGAKIVTDFIIHPRNLEIERDEQLRWPGWEGQRTPDAVIEFYRRRVGRIVALSDIYLCPSQSVADGLARFPAFSPQKVRVVPYGVSGVLLKPAARMPGRVLFAGAAGLRKGIPYLAQAATRLKEMGVPVVIVVAGAVSAEVAGRPETRNLTFLGALDKERMAEEFARADVFCLPSLAEGSATSVFEALANGLPVVTTASSGSVVVDGREGYIVPERDGAAIAEAIAAIVSDASRRQEMSEAAKAAAGTYGDDACGAAFVSVILELLGSPARMPEVA